MSVRRWVSASAIVVLGAGLVQQPVPAGATIHGAATMDYTDGGGSAGDPGCAGAGAAGSGNSFHDLMQGSRASNVPFRKNGVWHSGRLQREGTLGSSRVTATSTVQGRAVGDRWGTARLGARIATRVVADPASQPSICRVQYRVDNAVRAVDVAVRGTSWLVIRSSRSGVAGGFSGQFGALRNDERVRVLVAPGQSRKQLIPGGSYAIGGGTVSSVQVEAYSTATQVATAEVRAAVEIFPIGTRRTHSGATGYARSGHRSCTEHKVRITLTDKARNRARRITFYVDGDRRRVLTGSAIQRPGLTLRSIRPASYGKVRVVVLTRSGARRTMRSTTWPCRA